MSLSCFLPFSYCFYLFAFGILDAALLVYGLQSL